MTNQMILFVCSHNSARSIMAEAILRTKYGKHYEVDSAGTLPSSINPYTRLVLTELGISTDNLSSKSIEGFINKKIDLIVTVCDSAKENCPFIPGAKRLLHKSFQDPSKISGTDEEIMNGLRRVRDEIFDWIINEFTPKKLEKE
jgi:arsenate reductase